MARYRKVPVEIDAWEWDESRKTLQQTGCIMLGCCGHRDRPDECINLRIETGAGTSSVVLGDFIVKSASGKYSVYGSGAFSRAYEKV